VASQEQDLVSASNYQRSGTCRVPYAHRNKSRGSSAPPNRNLPLGLSSALPPISRRVMSTPYSLHIYPPPPACFCSHLPQLCWIDLSATVWRLIPHGKAICTGLTLPSSSPCVGCTFCNGVQSERVESSVPSALPHSPARPCVSCCSSSVNHHPILEFAHKSPDQSNRWQ
jgi:hypothetical protein